MSIILNTIQIVRLWRLQSEMFVMRRIVLFIKNIVSFLFILLFYLQYQQNLSPSLSIL